ncbi:hypothetical protein ACLKA7_017135 [Drosophila subpalustris]
MPHEQDQTLGVASLLQTRPGSGRRDFSSHTTTMPQNIFTNPAIQPSSVINLSNSTDVVIGPMTQYQGPVSIYYMDASMQTAAVMKLLLKVHGERTARNRRTPERTYTSSPASRINPNNTSNNSRKKSKRLTRNTILLGLLVLLVLIMAIIIVFLELNRTHVGEMGLANKAILFGNSYADGTFPNLGNGHLIIDRDQWGSTDQPVNLTRPLIGPVPYVLITHIGVQSKPCNTMYKCSIKMRTIQDSSIAEKHLPDISSNFYVSDEGNIYVGRSWEWANTYANNTLAIAFMGDYERYVPTKRQFEGVQHLLSHGVAMQILDVNYKMIALNQTRDSLSPGVNVYREIKKWSHFYHCDWKKGPKCGSELGMKDADWLGHQ